MSLQYQIHTAKSDVEFVALVEWMTEIGMLICSDHRTLRLWVQTEGGLS